jgi:hypothetical protein
MPNVAMLHEKDPKQEILDKLGNVLDDYEILNNEVLVATYLRPEKTASGFYLPKKTLEEDLFQSKCGLVLKIGPSCDFPTVKIQVHDWVVLRPADAWACEILTGKDPVHCRLLYDKHIRARITNPGLVW